MKFKITVRIVLGGYGYAYHQAGFVEADSMNATAEKLGLGLCPDGGYVLTKENRRIGLSEWDEDDSGFSEIKSQQELIDEISNAERFG